MDPIAGLLLLAGPVAGWLLWSRLPAAPGETADRLETAFASLLCGVFLTGCFALALAELGVLRPAPLLLVLTMLAAALWRLPRRSPAGRLPLAPHLAAAAFVAVLAAITLSPASEDMLGGRDPGTYANTAAWLARHGTLQVQSEALPTIAREARLAFVGSVLVPGFYIEDVARGDVVPQFLHLHPAWMAVGQWLGGIRGGFLVPPAIGVLAELAVFFFVRRTLGVGAALVAAVVLALNLAQIWGLRNPYSEGPMQLGFFAAFWCIAAAHATGGVRWGVLGGLALGTCFLLRLDALVVLVALLPALVFVAAGTRGSGRWITHALLPVAVFFALWGVAHAWFYSRPYVTDLAKLVRPLWLASAGTAALAALALARRQRLRRPVEWLHAHGLQLWLAAALALCALFAFAMWVRPHLEPFPVHRIRGSRTYIEATLPRIAWYFSTTGTILSLAGVVLLLRRWLVERRLEWLPFLSPVLAFSFLYLWNHRIHPDHPWMMRRFLPVIVPGMAVAMAAVVSFAWTMRGRWRVAARVVAAAALAVVLVHETLMALPFRDFREKRGLVTQLSAFASHVPDGSVLLFSYPGADSHVTTPLAFFWSRDVLPVIPDRKNDATGERRRRRFEAQVAQWLRRGRQVHYLTANDADSIFLSRDIRWEEVASLRVDVPTMGSSLHGPPRAPVRHAVQYRLLRAASALEAPRPCAGSAVSTGGLLGNVTQGFERLDYRDRELYYHATPDARIRFPACDRTGAGRPALLRTSAACAPDLGASGCRVAVTINGEPAGELPLAPEFGDHDLPIPAATVSDPTGPIEVRFRAPAPAPSGPGADDRASFLLMNVSLVQAGTP